MIVAHISSASLTSLNSASTCPRALTKKNKNSASTKYLILIIGTLQGTQAKEKNEMLFNQFGINYDKLPEMFKKGSCVFRNKVYLLKYKSVIILQITPRMLPQLQKISYICKLNYRVNFKLKFCYCPLSKSIAIDFMQTWKLIFCCCCCCYLV